MKRFLLSLTLLVAGAASASAQTAWPEGAVAQYRIEVTRNIPANDPHLICAVRFFSGGLLGNNSQNIRVTNAKGSALPLQIVYTHPLNACLVLFPWQPGEETYRVFFGGTVTPGAGLTNFNHGIFYETRERPEGDATSWESMRKLWAAATNSLGIAVVGDMVTRCNPFDESDNQFLSRTSGAWRTPREDVYKFALFAKDQGFLSINGEPVASTEFDPAARTQSVGDALVPDGVQQMEILQAKATGQGVTGVSWLSPWPEYSGNNLAARPIAPAWHPGVVLGLARDYEARQPFYACFNDFQIDMLLPSDQPVVLVRFHNRSGGKTAGLAYRWDFGDGSSSTEENPQHLYLKPGRYLVTLTAGGTSRFSKMVLATSFSSVPAQKVPMVESINPWAAAEMIRVATPFLEKGDAATVWTLMTLADKIEDRKARAEAILKLGPVYLAKSGDMPKQTEIPVREQLANARADLGQWDAAVAELRQMESKLDKQRSLRTKLRLDIGQLYQRAGKLSQALQVYAQVVADKGGDDPKMQRSAQMAMGNTYLQQGDIGAARKLYEEAAQNDLGDGRAERERAIRRGSLYSTLRQAVTELAKLRLNADDADDTANRETVRTLTETAQTSLQSLIFEFPAARLNPDVLYLSALDHLLIGDEEGCQSELKTLAKAEPSGTYTLRSMLLQARLNLRNKEYDKALALVEAVLKSTKEEDLVKEATALKGRLAERPKATKRTKETKGNLVPNSSFETGNGPFPVELSAPVDAYKVTVENGFGTEGKRCLKIELLKAVAPPCYLTVRFPTSIGDRLFARCRILSEDADVRWSEVRRSSTQADSLYVRIGSDAMTLYQWGWLGSSFNAEPWRQFSWRTGPATAGEPAGAISFAALPRAPATVLPAGTRIYIDDVECYSAP